MTFKTAPSIQFTMSNNTDCRKRYALCPYMRDQKTFLKFLRMFTMSNNTDCRKRYALCPFMRDRKAVLKFLRKLQTICNDHIITK